MGKTGCEGMKVQPRLMGGRVLSEITPVKITLENLGYSKLDAYFLQNPDGTAFHGMRALHTPSAAKYEIRYKGSYDIGVCRNP